MKTWFGMLSIAALLLGLNPMREARAQAPAAGPLNSREAIDQAYRREVAAAEKARILRLAELAATQSKADAEKTYEELFQFAISVGLYNEAEPIAERAIATETALPVIMLANLVNIVAEANRGAYEESLASLTRAIQAGEEEAKNGNAKALKALPQPAKLSLVNIYLQRLIATGQFDIAKKAMALIGEKSKDPAVKALVKGRLTQVELIGKPAPPINGTDFDGKPVSLKDRKGEVVLLVFWASWCIQNAQQVAQFEEALAKFGQKGLKVIGINVDTLQDGGLPVETVMPNIRRFLVDNNIRWPNLLNGTGPTDFAKAYGVTEVPTNILVGRDGTVIHLDLNRTNMAGVIDKALATK